MQVESVKLIDRQDGRDFVLYDESGNEIFSARLLHGSKELQVLWTNSLPWTPHRLLSIKRLLSESEDFEIIVGQATAEFADAIEDGTISAEKMAQHLSRALQAKWQIVIERSGPGRIGVVAACLENDL